MKTWHVPDMEARHETLRLWREYDRLYAVAQEPSPEYDALYDQYQERVQDARRWYDSEVAKLSGRDGEFAALELAKEAYFAAPGELREDEDGQPVLCVVTGAPLMEADEVIETGDGSLILASAFVPREILDQFSGADDDEAEIEEAA